jgi:hypothetical protein
LPVLLPGALIPIRDTLSVFWVVLPFSLATLSASDFVLVLTPVNFIVYIGVPIDVNIYISPMPVASTPSVAPRSTDGNTGRKSKRCSSHITRRVIIIGRVSWIGPRTVYYGWIIAWHVDDLWVRLFDNNRFFLNNNLLLVCSLQIAL